MKILCNLKLHKWSKWEYVKPIGRWDERYRRKCERCGKTEIKDVKK